MPTPNSSAQVHDRNQDVACDLARGNKHKGATKLETAGLTRAGLPPPGSPKGEKSAFRSRILPPITVRNPSPKLQYVTAQPCIGTRIHP